VPDHQELLLSLVLLLFFFILDPVPTFHRSAVDVLDELQAAGRMAASAAIRMRLWHLLILCPPISKGKAILSIVLGPLKEPKVFVARGRLREYTAGDEFSVGNGGP